MIIRAVGRAVRYSPRSAAVSANAAAVAPLSLCPRKPQSAASLRAAASIPAAVPF